MAQSAQSTIPVENSADMKSCALPSSVGARRLTSSMIALATGVDKLEELGELEIIFGGVSEIGGLERCTSLRTLTLIDCGLNCISNLEPVKHTLVKLCLCDQGLEKMENLCLPGLRELYLHQNKITRIEGLQGCPSLRTLWLFSNRIATLDGLHHCGGLQHLVLHDNNISTTAGLESLVQLQNLGLAANPIKGFQHLAGLRKLSSLTELSLDDVHFGVCPVVEAEGYREFVMCFLRQVRRLDGLEIAETDRSEVEDKYEAEALAYHDKLEDIERKRVHEIRQAEMARDAGAKRTCVLKKEMMRALEGLEELVREGRAAMEEERSRQEEIHESNFRILESALAELQRQYCREVEKLVQAEKAKAEEEERLFAALEERTCLERDYSQLVARQQNGTSQDWIAVQELSEHSPDLQKLRREVWANQKPQSGQSELMSVLRACRLYNPRLCEEFVSAAGDSTRTIRLYLYLSQEEVEAVCQEGLSALFQASAVLYPDPRQAAQAVHADGASAEKTWLPHTMSSTPAEGTGKVGKRSRSRDAGPRVILQLAVAVLEGEVEAIDASTEGSGGGDYTNGRRRENLDGSREHLRSEVRGKTGDKVQVSEADKSSLSGADNGQEGRRQESRGHGEPSPTLVERAVASERVLKLSFGLPPLEAEGVLEEDGGETQGQDCCVFLVPAKFFPRALPEFHLLCASGTAAEDRRALDAALLELSGDVSMKRAPETELLSQLEAKNDAAVKTYLERLQQEMTADEAHNLQAVDASIRKKASALASLRSEVDQERALQETLLCESARPDSAT